VGKETEGGEAEGVGVGEEGGLQGGVDGSEGDLGGREVFAINRKGVRVDPLVS
jgi:hypothetical protein